MLRPLAAIVPCQSTCLPHQHFLTAPAVPHNYMLSNKYCAVYNNWHTHIYRSLEIHVLRYAYDVKYTNSVLNIISSNFARLWTKIQLSLSSVNLGIFHCALIVQILSCSWFSYSESISKIETKVLQSMIRNYATMHLMQKQEAVWLVIQLDYQLYMLHPENRAYSDVLGGSMVGEPISWT